MDRYSRGYDDRYRGYYDRPRSDTYRPGENYRPERDYRDGSGRGGRNYSPNPHYPSSRSPGGRGGGSSGGLDSRGSGDEGYPKDHRYSYNDSRPYYPPSRGHSPSRSGSRSPRRPSYGYYRSGPSSSYPYSSRRSPSPPSGGRSGSSSRRDSYDHRPYHSSMNYPSYPPYHRGGSGGHPGGSYPHYSSRRHFGGPPPFPPSSSGSGYGTPSGYRSREPSLGPPSKQHHQPPPQQQQERSIHSTPNSTAPNSPRQSNYNAPAQAAPSIATTLTSVNLPSTQQQMHPQRTPPEPSETRNNISHTITTANTTTTTNINKSNPPSQQPSPSIPHSTNYPPSSSYPYSGPPSSSPYAGSGGGPGARPHHHSYSHNPHYSSNYQSHHNSPSALMPPVRQRISWAPEQEKEVERYHNDQRKLCEEENKVLVNVRKSRFELELANWDTRKLEHQLGLVQKQWEDNGMEQLVKEEMNARLPGRPSASVRTTVPSATSLSIL